MDKIFMNVSNGSARPIVSAADIGQIIRQERTRQGVTQVVAAQLCGVSVHFLSNLERGKETSELARVFQVLNSMNIRLYATTPGGER